MHSPVLRFLVFTSSLFLLFSCTPQRYAVVSSNTLSSQSGENWETNFVPVPNEYLGSGILRIANACLIARDFSRLRVVLDSAERKDGATSEIYLAKSISCICRKKYEKGAEQLVLVTDEKYIMLRRLLTIDFNYETSRQKGFASFSSFLDEYQKLADQYINHEYMMKLIKVRVRRIRYNTLE